MSEKFLTGVDFGSNSIKIAVGSVNKEGNLQIVSAVEEPTLGINKGMITDLEETVTSFSRALEKIERLTGKNIDHGFVGISNPYIISQPSHGVIAISSANGEIKEEDIKRVLEAAETVASPPNYEILHTIPISFTVDSQSGIKDPLGMTGVRLEVDTQVIEVLSTQIKMMDKCLTRVGFLGESLIYSPLACAEVTLEKREKEIGVALINLGSTTTSLIVFEEGDILTTKVLPIGSRHITSDIAIGLKISIDLAEMIKLFYGCATVQEIGKDEKIDLSEIDEKEKGFFSKKQVAEIVEARVEEIFKMVDKELSLIKRSGKLPAGVVLTGGGAKLKAIEILAKKVLKLPAKIGYPKNVSLMVEKANDPIFTNAIGLVVFGKESSPQIKETFSLKKIFEKFFKKIFL
jgi:cell division protein FtsA